MFDAKYLISCANHYRLVHANSLHILLGASLCFVGLQIIFEINNWFIPTIVSTVTAFFFQSIILYFMLTPCNCKKSLLPVLSVRRRKVPFHISHIPAFVWSLLPVCMLLTILPVQTHFVIATLGAYFIAIGVVFFSYGASGLAAKSAQMDVILESETFDLNELEKKSQNELHSLLDYALRVGELTRADLLSKHLLDQAEKIEPERP